MVTELLLFQNIEKQYRALLTSPKGETKGHSTHNTCYM